MKQPIEHADDELVLSGWNPGEGRTLPPTKNKFVFSGIYQFLVELSEYF